MSKATSKKSTTKAAKKPKQRRGEPVALKTPDFLAEQAEQLRQLMPHVFTEGKIDVEKLRVALGDSADERPERYSFTWAGKRAAIQELQKPTWATLVPAKDESINFNTTQNIFIEGENLEVLKLLYKSYFGRVKMLYIDSPYNTGGDFVYPDNFANPKDAYLKITGQKDDDGNLRTSNPESGGRYHSAWLSMIYPRLFLARQLLCEDGIVLASIDDNEVHNLRLVMNEIFGEENFVAQIVWKSRQFPDARAVTRVSTDHEYVLVYSRGARAEFRGAERDETKFSNPDKDSRGLWMSRSLLGLATKEQRRNLHYQIVDPKTGHSFSPPANTGWRYGQTKMNQLIAEGCILFPTSADGRPREKKFRKDLEHEFTSFPTIIDDVFTAHGTAEIRELFGFQAFDFPKPTELLRRFVEQTTSGNDVIIDLFAGSASGAHAVIKQNACDGACRVSISIQLPHPNSIGTEVHKHGFATIADIAKERLRRAGKQLSKAKDGELKLSSRNAQLDVGFAVFKLVPSGFKPWVNETNPSPETLAKAMELFNDPLADGWKSEDIIYEVAIKEGFSLTARLEKVSTIKANNIFGVTDLEKGQSFRICLDDELKSATVKELNLKKDDLFICRDVAIDDKMSANLALQCRFKTI
jgi:adenine-specific DNA-methyltransferase